MVLEKEFNGMSKKDMQDSKYYKAIIDELFSFVKEADPNWQIIFTKEWIAKHVVDGILINRQLCKQISEFDLHIYDVDIILYNMIELYIKKLVYVDYYSISISKGDVPILAAVIYNNAVIKGKTVGKKIPKSYIKERFKVKDARIEKICKKANLEFNRELFDDFDVSYEEEILNKDFKSKVENIDWKAFLLSLLPEKELLDFTIQFSDDRRIRNFSGKYYEASHKIKIPVFKSNNNWDQIVDTFIHEFCHHLETCKVFSHYEREQQETHTPLFYAAIDILQNKSVLMGINLSDKINDISSLEEKCSVNDLITLCRELGVEYDVIRNMKPDSKNQHA